MIKLSFSAGATGDGVARTLAQSGTGELAFFFGVPVGAGVTSLSVVTKDVCFSLFTSNGANPFWFC